MANAPCYLGACRIAEIRPNSLSWTLHARQLLAETKGMALASNTLTLLAGSRMLDSDAATSTPSPQTCVAILTYITKDCKKKIQEGSIQKTTKLECLSHSAAPSGASGHGPASIGEFLEKPTASGCAHTSRVWVPLGVEDYSGFGFGFLLV